MEFFMYSKYVKQYLENLKFKPSIEEEQSSVEKSCVFDGEL